MFGVSFPVHVNPFYGKGGAESGCTRKSLIGQRMSNVYQVYSYCIILKSYSTLQVGCYGSALNLLRLLSEHSCRFCVIKVISSLHMSPLKHLKAGIRSVSPLLGQQVPQISLSWQPPSRLNGPRMSPPSILARRLFRMVLVLGQ